MYWLASSIYLPLVGALAGLEAVAAYRATDNLLLPVSQALTALGLPLLPYLSRQNGIRGCGYLRAAAAKVALAGGAGAGVYVLVILGLGPRLVRLLYGGDYYAGYLSLVPYLGVAVVLRAIGDTGFGIALKAAGRPDLGFRATAAAAVTTLTVGLGLVSRHGASGAAAGWAASSAAGCAVSVWLCRRRLR